MDGGGHAVRLSRKTTQRKMSLMDEIKSVKHKGEDRCSLEATAPTKAWRCEIVVLERCGGTEMASVWRHERQAFVKSSSFYWPRVCHSMRDRWSLQGGLGNQKVTVACWSCFLPHWENWSNYKVNPTHSPQHCLLSLITMAYLSLLLLSTNTPLSFLAAVFHILRVKAPAPLAILPSLLGHCYQHTSFYLIWLFKKIFFGLYFPSIYCFTSLFSSTAKHIEKVAYIHYL